MKIKQSVAGILVLILLIIFFLWYLHPSSPSSTPSPEANKQFSNRPPDEKAVRAPTSPLPRGATNPAGPHLAELTQKFEEEMRADPSYQFKVPIRFYGKVLDQDEKPVSEVSVSFEWNTLDQTNGLVAAKAGTKSDSQGLFSLEGQKGTPLCVILSKIGYYTPKENPGCFEYAQPYAVNYHIPDPNNPVVFRLRRRGTSEPLVKGEKLFGFKPDGTQYYVNLLTGKKSMDPTGEWDLSINVTRSAVNSDRKFDWFATIDASNGGLIETNDDFAFVAPESGYQPIHITQNASDAAWQSGIKARFFVKSRDGKIYSRIETEITPDYNENAAINMKYFVNPSGSRNLEFDPNNVVQPSQ